MFRVNIKPTTFDIFDFQENQNNYIHSHTRVNKKKALQQHAKMESTLTNALTYTIHQPTVLLPDIVFIANGGICLPRLPRTILLPSMKYLQRQAELPFLIQIYKDLGLTMIPPMKEVFEGQAELKWFAGGTKAIGGYGFRSTKKSFDALKKLLKKVYEGAGLQPPEILAVPLESSDYYHLDVAMLELGDRCIVHKRAFSAASIKKMRDFLGAGAGGVSVIDVADSFCLNSLIDGDTLITHTLDAPVKKLLEELTGKTVQQVDTSEFEKSGGSIRCMNLDVF